MGGLRIVAQGQEPPSLRDLDLDSSALDLRALAMEREMADLELRSLRESSRTACPRATGRTPRTPTGAWTSPRDGGIELKIWIERTLGGARGRGGSDLPPAAPRISFDCH